MSTLGGVPWILVLDTDVASLSIKRRLSPPMRARLSHSLICVTFVTLGELTRWVLLHDWGPTRRRGMAEWLSGVVKLRSGDVTWRGLTALQYHYETQPLPTWTSWYMHQLPGWFQQLGRFNSM